MRSRGTASRSPGAVRAALIVVVAIASLPAACTSDGSSSTSTSETTPLGDPDAPRYETTAAVIGTDRQTQVCRGVEHSYPPQCGGGTPIDGWDWESVPHESSGPVRWGTYELVVTYDRARSRYAVAGPVAEPVPDVDAPPDPDHLLNVNCPEPDGGWQWADVTEEEQEAFLAHAASLDGFAGSRLITIGFGRDAGQRQISVAYLDEVDVDARRAELQAMWPAPICVLERTHTLGELQAIASEFQPREGQDPSRLPYGAIGYANFVDYDGVIRLPVLIEEPGAQEELDARFGPGAVVLEPTLRLVD
jgi:hypothetical protein